MRQKAGTLWKHGVPAFLSGMQRINKSFKQFSKFIVRYNKPLEYAQLVLGGEIEHYLSLGCDHGRMED